MMFYMKRLILLPYGKQRSLRIARALATDPKGYSP
jgi:ABC-type branched-subunit amino acid transport system ATPase component